MKRFFMILILLVVIGLVLGGCDISEFFGIFAPNVETPPPTVSPSTMPTYTPTPVFTHTPIPTLTPCYNGCHTGCPYSSY